MPKVLPLTAKAKGEQKRCERIAYLGRLIRSKRVMLGFVSDFELAEKIGMPASTLYLRIRDPGTVRMDELFRLAEHLKFTPEEMLKFMPVEK